VRNPFGYGARCTVSGSTRAAAGGSRSITAPVSRNFRHAELDYWNNPVTRGEFSVIPVGHARAREGPDPDGVPTFRWQRHGRGRAPSMTRGRRCPHGRAKAPQAARAASQRQPLQPGNETHQHEAHLRASSRVHPVHTYGFPFTVAPDGAGNPGLELLSLAPRR